MPRDSAATPSRNGSSDGLEGSSGPRQLATRLEPSTTAHVTVEDGTRIYFETFSGERKSGSRSADRVPVLLLMGLGANGRLWAPAARRCLAAGFDVITIDNRGCGRSDTPWLPWTTRTMATDAITVLDELGVEQAHVCGASLGGMVAQEVALEFPERVSKLVLACTTGGFPRLDLAPRRGLLDIAGGALRSLWPGGDDAERVSHFVRMVASEEFSEEIRPGDETWDSVEAMLEDPTPPRGYALQLLAAMRHSTWSRLGELSMPVQVHHGTDDRLMPFENGRQLVQHIPNARFVIHHGAGHALFECTEEVAERQLAFLSEREAPASTRARDAKRSPSTETRPGDG